MNFEIQTSSYFDTEAKRLAKRHRSFVDDLQDFRDSLLKNPYQGTELSPGIRKVRLTIDSKGRGKSGGARVITFTYLVDEKNGVVILLLLYDKADASSIKMNVVRQIIKDLGLNLQQLQSEGKLKAVEIKEENEEKGNTLETIKLTKENYKTYLPISMVAFSYNLSALENYKGHVFVIDDKGVSFEIDNRNSEFSVSDILGVCPFIESISITPKRVVAPEGWKVVELDKKILAINTTIYKRFISTLNKIIWAHNYPNPENLHHFDENWKEAVVNVVSKEHK